MALAETLVRDRVARIASEILAPAVLVAALMLVVGWHAGDQPGVSRWWGLPGALFAAGIPLAYVLRGVRKGHLTSHHIPEREHRRMPLLFGIASVVGGLVVFTAVTHWWKMSIHAGVAAGTVATLVAIYGPPALVGVPLVLLACWARVRLSAHTTPQVVAGALVGALIAGTVFQALR